MLLIACLESEGEKATITKESEPDALHSVVSYHRENYDVAAFFLCNVAAIVGH
jgi:hypothetical protein